MRTIFLQTFHQFRSIPFVLSNFNAFGLWFYWRTKNENPAQSVVFRIFLGDLEFTKLVLFDFSAWLKVRSDLARKALAWTRRRRLYQSCMGKEEFLSAQPCLFYLQSLFSHFVQNFHFPIIRPHNSISWCFKCSKNSNW